jgi:hypothetical protein
VKINRKKTIEVDAKVLKVHAKPCDSGGYELLDSDGDTIFDAPDAYVPSFMPDGGGDYIVLDIELDTGRILNWKVPTAKKIEDWIVSQEGDGD